MPERGTEVAAHGITMTPWSIELIPGQRSGFIETPWIDTAIYAGGILTIRPEPDSLARIWPEEYGAAPPASYTSGTAEATPGDPAAAFTGE